MSEINRAMTDQQSPQFEVDTNDSVASIDEFLQTEAQTLSQLLGVRGMNIRVGEGWSTNLETGEVTIDPRFFLERGYSPDMATYAGLHEVAAHLREVLTEPNLTRQVRQFVSLEKVDDGVSAEARGIFHNIFSDIAGNNLTHAVLPRMSRVAEPLYRDKLFPEDDYQTIPRHLQFLYKAIRDEMIPNSTTIVAPEVDALLDEFRDFHGTGKDLIKYSTQVAKSSKQMMSGQEKFDLWTKVIYPRWLELYEQDRDDPDFQEQPNEMDGEGIGEQEDNKPQSNNTVFSEHYERYRTDHHSEPMSEDEHTQIEQTAKKIVRKTAKESREQRRAEQQAVDPSYQHDTQIRREMGHSLADLQAYNREIERWHEAIDEVRSLFRNMLNEHVGTHRRLRGGHSEGAILTPDRLAQTIVDVRSGIAEPRAFSNYEHHVSERELTGKTDYIFVFDRSGSMDGEKSQSAASSSVICLEALAGVQRDIEEFQTQTGIDADVDIRTAIYTFNDTINIPKPLGHSVTQKERLDTYGLVGAPGGGNADSHVLQIVSELPSETDRNQILIIVSDGEADNPSLARAYVEQLRRANWSVYGISIGSEAAVELYAPHSRRVDDPSLLPDVMKQLIEETI